jgi:hypothetical protein
MQMSFSPPFLVLVKLFERCVTGTWRVYLGSLLFNDLAR